MSVVRVFACLASTAVLLVGLPAMTGCTSATDRLPHHQKQSVLLEQEVLLGLGVAQNRKFYLGRTEVGVPPQAFVRLYTVCSNTVTQVARHDSFAGLLRLKTEEEALAFCRFFTSMDSRWCFTDRRYYDVTVSKERRAPLTISPQTAEIIQYHPPLVTITNGIFRVVRYVVDDDQNLFLLTEECKSDGTFVVRDARPVGVAPEVIIPIIE